MDEQRKLAEARYFLEQMERCEREGNTEVFCYNTSAFLSAARSVMQYIHRKAKARGRLEWYQQIHAAGQWCGLFRDIRNSEVHEEPITDPPVLTLIIRYVDSLLDMPKEDHPEGTIVISLEHGMLQSFYDYEDERIDESDREMRSYAVDIGGKTMSMCGIGRMYLRELMMIVEKARQEGIIREQLDE